jgi:type II secretory ATPase GspE/PulE/Tfp pilus assembly ATPase PilB-like protein
VVGPITDEWEAKLKKVGMTKEELGGEIAYGPGCDECFHSGYAGRTAIYEFLPITEKIRTLVMDGASATEIKREQSARGYQTLRSDGREKVKLGQTTPDEVLRVTQLDI